MNLLYTREEQQRQFSWFSNKISECFLASKLVISKFNSDCEIIDKSYTIFPDDFYDQILSEMDAI